MIQPATERFILICWYNALQTFANGRDFLYVTDIFELLREMNSFLGVKSVLLPNELALLQSMAKDRPHLRLMRNEVSDFLLRLVQFDSMETFLLQRTHTTIGELTKLVDNYPQRKYEKIEVADRTRLRAVKKTEFEDTRAHRSIFQPRTLSSAKDLTGDLTGWFRKWRAGGSKETQSAAHRSEIIPDTKPYVKSSVSDLKDYTSTLDKKTYSSSSSSYQERKIQELERLCLEYERQLSRNSTSESKLKELAAALEQQDKLIAHLERKFEHKKTLAVTSKLPLWERFYTLWTDQKEKSTVGAWVLAIFSLMLVFITLTSCLKLVYYIGLYVLLTPPTSYDYIYDSEVEQIPSFALLLEFPWLEYKIYQVAEWFGY